MKPNTILNYLRQSQQHLSGEEISRKLGVSRSAIWKEIQQLRDLGYEIEAQPHLGYRLTGIPDRLLADEITHGLRTKVIGKTVIAYENLDSTNDAVFALGKQNAEEGLVIVTEHQKKGKGRLGRTWVSPKHKGVLASLLLRPPLAPSEIARITLGAAVSIVKTIRSMTEIQAGIKWPNDVVYRDKKIAGILTEMSAESDRVNFVVLGVGVNLNTDLKDLPPGSTSLKAAAGRNIDRIEFLRRLLAEIEEDYFRLKKNSFSDLAKEWEEYSATTGRRVTATLLDRKIHGEATGIDRDGALWIRKDNGLQERIFSGDIQHLR